MVLFRWFIGLLALCLWAPTAQAVQISLPNVEAARGEIVRVPVSVSRFEAGDEVLSASMDVRFDASIVAIKDISVNRSGSLAESWIVAVNARTVPGGGENDGQLLIGAATANAKISGEGVFFFLEMQVSASADVGSISPIVIEKVQLNNGTRLQSSSTARLPSSKTALKPSLSASPSRVSPRWKSILQTYPPAILPHMPGISATVRPARINIQCIATRVRVPKQLHLLQQIATVVIRLR